jgi:Leucine-rich repeat (LRR) protein
VEIVYEHYLDQFLVREKSKTLFIRKFIFIDLIRLKSLSLHNNQFSALPPDIIRLDLQELSLRNNPLVVRFVRDLTYDVPTLKELAGRTIKLHKLSYDDKSIPKSLMEYLNSAKSCLNPKCKGLIRKIFEILFFIFSFV